MSFAAVAAAVSEDGGVVGRGGRPRRSAARARPPLASWFPLRERGRRAVARRWRRSPTCCPPGLTPLDRGDGVRGRPAARPRLPPSAHARGRRPRGRRRPLTVRPGATRALRRVAPRRRRARLAPDRSGAAETEIDARGLHGPLVLRLAGWAGGEAGFTAGVEVTAARALTRGGDPRRPSSGGGAPGRARAHADRHRHDRAHLPGARPGRADDRDRGRPSLSARTRWPRSSSATSASTACRWRWAGTACPGCPSWSRSAWPAAALHHPRRGLPLPAGRARTRGRRSASTSSRSSRGTEPALAAADGPGSRRTASPCVRVEAAQTGLRGADRLVASSATSFVRVAVGARRRVAARAVRGRPGLRRARPPHARSTASCAFERHEANPPDFEARLRRRTPRTR